MKKIRVLCLHGLGDNAAIFRIQTSSIRELLPSSYEFLFIEGGELCDPLPGQVYSGLYRCWYLSPSTEKVAKAQELVRRVIESKGPFDVVMGFSQRADRRFRMEGASLAASLILHQQLDHPASPPLFHAAIFLSAPLPFSRHLNHGIDCRVYFSIPHPEPLPGRPTAIPAYLIPSDAFFLQSESNDSFYQMFHFTVDEARIAIPTAHVFGRRDALWRTHAKDLVEMCGGKDADGVYVHEHDGAHEIPKDEVEEICDVIENAVAKAALA